MIHCHNFKIAPPPPYFNVVRPTHQPSRDNRSSFRTSSKSGLYQLSGGRDLLSELAQLHSGLWRSGPGRTSLDWILYTSFTSGVACCLPGWSFSGQPTTLASYICIADGEADVSVPTHRSTETPVWCVIVTIPSHQNRIRSLQRRSCR